MHPKMLIKPDYSFVENISKNILYMLYGKPPLGGGGRGGIGILKEKNNPLFVSFYRAEKRSLHSREGYRLDLPFFHLFPLKRNPGEMFFSCPYF
jgi:hypothetical protein